jgi:hypothetical protein
MRVLVIPEKAASPKIHWYNFQKELPPAGMLIGGSNGTLPRFGRAQCASLDRQFISKINGRRFCLTGPLDPAGHA